jgi:hypothetical protein
LEGWKVSEVMKEMWVGAVVREAEFGAVVAVDERVG